MYKILKKETIAPATFKMDVLAERIAKKAQPGQFVILRPTQDGERIPLTISDSNKDEGSVTIIFQVVGMTTRILSQMEIGDTLSDFVGPLGRASELKHLKKVLCIGGGVGTAVVYPDVKYLHENGAIVDVIIGARSKEYIILEDEIKQRCRNLYITTDDGTAGIKGFVTDKLKELLDNGEEYDEVYAIGPMIMMKFVSLTTKKYGVKTMVSLNPIMVDGTGMCGCCRVKISGEVKYACVDGPDFDGHEVDYDDVMRRLETYKEIEKENDEQHACKGIYHN
ncbi:MAG: sulfide/dihydroorotate dehydrogenase-like FAD/NAD-binding protein [Clostridiales bacterium]|nr:sulfide/dihydroorotate dehydrogenase-like FAD/NAD-binding protein [Clostridiales bacterium]